MEGKVVSYDPVKGVGKIISKKNGIKIFNIDSWLDYDKLPEIGLEVEFELEKDNISNIFTLNSGEELLNKLNDKLEYSLPVDLKIEENVSLNECLEDFFGKFKKLVFKYKDLLSNNYSLPYKKIRRFLFTAYNNLLDIDSQINDSRLREIKNSLDEIEYNYDKLLNEIKNPIYVILEKLVLTKQKNYQILKKKFEDNKSLITENTKISNLIEIKVENIKNKLIKLNPKTKEYKEQFNLLKAYKRKYVDLIDDTQNLKEFNSKIINDIAQFEKVYQKIFSKFFNKEINIILSLLQKELDILAYQFDTVLWENAKISKQIQRFFEESKIEGSYSTKTFMKYYLKNLKTDKMNQKDIELVEVFNELQVFNKSVVIYSKHREAAREISITIENLDHDIDVKIFDTLKDFIKYITAKEMDINIVIVEINDLVKPMVNKIKPILEKVGVKFILFDNSSKFCKELKHII